MLTFWQHVTCRMSNSFNVPFVSNIIGIFILFHLCFITSKIIYNHSETSIMGENSFLTNIKFTISHQFISTTWLRFNFALCIWCHCRVLMTVLTVKFNVRNVTENHRYKPSYPYLIPKKLNEKYINLLSIKYLR